MNDIANRASCTVCSQKNLKTVIDLGRQPPANRFMPNHVEDKQADYPLAFGYCVECGTMQLTERMPIAAIRPQFAWLLYNEPEGHLDDVAENLLQLPGMQPNSKILGITYKDQSTIDRLTKLGLNKGATIQEADFSISSPLFGLETIQQALRDTTVINHLKQKYGQADLLLMRHVLEHADHAIELMLALKSLIKPNGYLLLELPDSEKIINAHNHAFIWEEHISYFTEQSLTLLANRVGAKISWFKRYTYPYEDSLLVALQFTHEPVHDVISKEKLTQLDAKLMQFSRTFTEAKTNWRNTLKTYLDAGEKIAVFGAGHLAVKWVNFFNLADLIDCVIDDHPAKTQMKMPGSLLKIKPSALLSEQGFKICISTLSPESEIKVKQKLASFFNQGGVFLPAFTVKSRDEQRIES